MENKHTAVEWLAKQVLEYKNPTNVNGTDYVLIPINKIEFLQAEAKEMEKEQIKEAYCMGDNNIGAEQYYNETFKSE